MVAARFSSDGEYIALCRAGERVLTIGRFNAETLDYHIVAKGYYHALEINDIAWSPVRGYLATCSEDSDVVLWKLTEGAGKEGPEAQLDVVRRFFLHASSVNTIDFNARGTNLVSASMDTTVYVWDVLTGQMLSMFRQFPSPVTSAVFANSGQLIATTCLDGYYRALFLHAPKEHIIGKPNNEIVPLGYVQMTPDDKYMLLRDVNGGLVMWDYVKRQTVRRFALPGGPQASYEFKLCRPNWVVSGAAHGIDIYDAKDASILRTIKWDPIFTIDVNECKRVGVGSCAGEKFCFFRLDKKQ